MVFNATFYTISVISWRSVLLVEEIGENHRPIASQTMTLFCIDYTSPYTGFELTTLVVIGMIAEVPYEYDHTRCFNFESAWLMFF